MSWCDLGVTFDLGPDRMLLLPCLRHILPFTKMYGLLQLIIICTLLCCGICIGSYTSINKFYGFVMFNLLINAVNLQLNCLVLILCL